MQRIEARTHGPGLELLEHGGDGSEAALVAEVSAWLGRPYDLLAGPVYRFGLLRVDARRHVLMLDIHHIAVDGFSAGLLLRDLVAGYVSEIRGEPPPETRPDPFVSFIAEQGAEASPAELAAHEAYWREELSGASATIPPQERGDWPAAWQGARARFELSPAASQALPEAARKLGVTTFEFLLASFSALLFQLWGGAQIHVGYAVSTRGRQRDVFGCLVNNIPARAQLSAGMSLAELVVATKRRRAQQKAHERVPYSSLVRWARRGELGEQGRLYAASITRANFALTGPRLPGLETRALTIHNGGAKDALGLLYDFGDRLIMELEYPLVLFEAEEIEAISERFVALLVEGIESPERTLAALGQGLARRPRSRLQGPALGSGPETLPDLLHSGLEASSARVVAGERSLAGSELLARARGLARSLAAHGVDEGERVLLCLPRGLELLVAQLGVALAGAAQVPVDPRHPPARLRSIIEDARPQLALVCEQTRTLVPPWCPSFALDELPQPDTWSSRARGEGCAYLMYTSGSTGRPKGVAVRQRNLAACVRAFRALLGESQPPRWCALTTIAFDIAQLELWLPLSCGGTLHLLGEAEASDGLALARALEQLRPTHLQATPSTWSMLIEAGWAGDAELVALSGGEPLSRELADLLLARVGRLINVYGPTETTIWSTWTEVERGGAIHIGRPIPGTHVEVLDEQLRPVAPGDEGILFIGGAGVAAGYWQRPELSARSFVGDPRDAGQILYRSGDRVRLAHDGTLRFLGRADSQVKIRGHRVELGEIEMQLCALAGVARAVVGVLGAGEGARLEAWVELREGVERSELDAALREQLPSYMIPAAIHARDRLPLTPNGKLDRALLLREAGERRAQTRRAVRAPGSLEHSAAEIWSQVLGHEQWGDGDDFFALGGHSLAANRVVARLQRRLGLAVPLVLLFEHPRFEDFCAQLRNCEPAPAPAPAPALPEWIVAPPVLRRLWFLSQVDEVGGAFHLVGGWRLGRELEAEALEAALLELRAREAMLGAHFELRGAQLCFRLARPPAPGLERLVLAHPLDDGRSLAWVRAWAEAPFETRREGLFRAGLFEDEAGERALVLAVHHLVADEWGVGLLLERLERLMETSPSSPAAAAPCAAQFYRPSARDSPDARWWVETLAELEPVELPLDHPRPLTQRYAGRRQVLQLSKVQRCALERACEVRGARTFHAVAALVAALVWRLTRARRFALGTMVAHREDPDSQAALGCFADLLVLVAELDPRAGLGAALDSMRASVSRSWARRELPFSELVEALGLARDPRRAPLLDVVVLLRERGRPQLRIGSAWEELERSRCWTAHDLVVEAILEQEGLRFELTANAALLDEHTLARWTAQLGQLCEVMVERPQQPLESLLALPPTLLRPSVVASLPGGARGLVAALWAQAQLSPGRVAVRGPERALDYASLTRASASLAAGLCARGVAPGQRVAACIARDERLPVALWGIWLAGASWVPLDPELPSARMLDMLDAAGCRLCLVDASAPASLRELDGAVELDRLLDAGAEAGVATMPARAELGDEAYLMFTSGSSGRPKGVVVGHAQLCSTLAALLERVGLTGSPSLLALTSVSFDISMLELVAPSLCGGIVNVATRAEARDPAALGERIVRDAVDTVQATPTTWRMLIESGWRPPRGFALLCGGEPFPEALLDALDGPEVAVWNLYGPTETTIWSTAARLRAGAPVTIGTALAGEGVFVLDERGRAVPEGSVGELWITGSGLARYLDERAGAGAAFVELDADAGPVRAYRTGDRGRLRSDGTLECLGRRDLQIKLHGQRFELGELEHHLRAHEGVSEAVVSLAHAQLVAWIECAEASAPKVQQLREHLRERVPAALIPARFEFMAALPTNASGKLDRPQLQRRAGERARVSDWRPGPGPAHTLAAAWADARGNPPARAHDDFFLGGGDSLAAVRLLALLEQRLGVRVALRELFAAPSFDAQLELVRAALSQRADSPLAQLEGAPLELSLAQLDYLASAGERAAAVDWIPVRLRLREPARFERLLQALLELVYEYEALRTSLGPGDEPRVELLEPELVCEALREQLGQAEPRALQPASIAASATHPVAGQPLVRGLRGPEQELVLLFHHLIVDGPSLALLMRQLAAKLRAPSPSPTSAARRLQPSVMAAWQRSLAFAAEARRTVRWWVGELAGLRPLELRGVEHEAPSEGRAEQLGVSLPDYDDPARAAVAFALALQTLDPRDDIALGIPLANRARPELAELVGFLSHTAVLRVVAPPAGTLGELVSVTRSRLREMQLHACVPYSHIVRGLPGLAGAGPGALLRAVLSIEDADTRALEDAGLELGELEWGWTPFDLVLVVRRTQRQAILRWDSTRVSAEIAKGLARALERAAVSVRERPGQTCADLLSALGPSERLRDEPNPQALEQLGGVLEAALDPSERDVALVARRGWSRTQLRERVQLERGAALGRVRLVDRIPRTPLGEVDWDGLRAVPAHDALDREQAQAQLGDAVDAVYELPAPRPGRRLHVDQLRLSPAPESASAEDTAGEGDARSRERAPARSSRPARTGDPVGIWGAALPRSLGAALVRAAREHEHTQLLTVAADGSRQAWSYAELYGQAARGARQLRALGVCPGDRVLLASVEPALCLPAFWACQLVGALVLVLEPPRGASGRDAKAGEPGLDEERSRHAIEVLEPAAILATSVVLADFGQLGGQVALVSLPLASMDGEPEPEPALELEFDPDVPALLMMTSGSSGRPKLVELTHRNLLTSVAGTSTQLDLDASARTLSWMSLAHVAGLVYFHLRDLWLGCFQVHVNNAYVLADPRRWLELLDAHAITLSFAPNFGFAAVLHALREHGVPAGLDLHHVRGLLDGGEAIVPDTASAFVAELADCGLSADAIWPAWGMSETASGIVAARRLVERGGFVELGEVIPGAELRIVDEGGQLVDEGVVGALEVRGAVVSPGYYSDPERSAAARTRDGWFKTGDCAQLRDGRLTLEGRAQDVIIIRGVNYVCHEIEAVAERTPAVLPGHVAALATRAPGADTDQLALFVALSEAASPAILADIRRRVSALTGSSLARLLVVEPEQLPRTNLGKLRRSTLAQELAAGRWDARQRELDLLEANERTIPSLVHVQRWVRARGREPAPGKLRALLIAPPPAFARSLAARFGSACQQLVADTPKALARALTRLERGEGPLALVHFELEQRKESEDPWAYGATIASWIDAQPQAFRQTLRWVMVTCEAQAALPSDRPNPRRACMGALLRCASQELGVSAAHIDLEPEHPRAGEQLVDEVLAPSPEPELALRHGLRFAPRLEPIERVEDASLPAPGGTWLLSGGTGGIAQAFTRLLIERLGARVIALGTPRAQELESAHSDRVEVLRVDLGEGAASEGLAARLARLAEAGELRGVVHLAGMFEPSSAVNWETRALERHLQPRLELAQSLLELTPDSCPIYALSSTTAMFGGVGMAAYAAAHRALEALACVERPAPFVVVRSAAWSGTGMFARAGAGDSALATAAMDPHDASLGLWLAFMSGEARLSLGLDTSRASVSRLLLGRARAQGALVAVGRASAPAQPVELSAASSVTIVDAAELRSAAAGEVDLDELAACCSVRSSEAARSAPRGEIELLVAELWRGLLGGRLAAREDDFFSLGGHSVMVPQLCAALRERLGLEVPVRLLFERPRLDEFCLGLAKLAELRAAELERLLAEIELGPDLREMQ